MILATANKAQRLLYLKFVGNVTGEEMRAQAVEVQTLVAELGRDFRLLSDLEQLQSMDKECVPELEKRMDFFKSAGIELVVRIVPDSHKDIGLNILSVFHYGRSVRNVTCKDFPEALRALKL